MKKLLAVALAVVMLVGVLCGCSPKEEEFQCGVCGQQVTSVRYPADIQGQEVDICQGCYDGLKEAGLLK